MAKVRTEPKNISLSGRQRELQKQLSRAIGAALPRVRKITDALRETQSPYRRVAEVLVMLRHEFPDPNGEGPDLSGRSAAYRAVVRGAYVQAGADPNGPLPKRLTAGTAYWVRKILLERYGTNGLHAIGASPRRSISAIRDRQQRSSYTGDDKLRDLQEAVGVLNVLASDPEIIPTEELARAAMRAVELLRQKLTSKEERNKLNKIAV